MKNEKKFSSKASLLSKWRNRDKTSIKDVSKISPIPEGIPVPLSSEQKRLWFLQQLLPNNPFYNYAELYRLKGDVNSNYLEKSIRLIEETHDVLRANFKVKDGLPTVVTSSASNSPFDFYDFSNLSHEEATTKAQSIIHENASAPFHLSKESLLRFVLIKITHHNFLFLSVIHHIIIDKWSLNIFRKELAQHYSNLVNKIPITLKKPSIQYASYAYWQQNQNLNSNHLNYWKDTLSGKIPVLNLPTDYPKKAQPTYKGALHKNVYNANVSNGFINLCQHLETTPYVTMLSIFYVLLQKYSKQNDILVGTPITKRNETSLEQLIGFFNDTLVLRTEVNTALSFKNLVERVKGNVLNAFSNKDVSFDVLVKTLKPTRSLNTHPFFQVMFLYHKEDETPTFSNDIEISYEPYDAKISKFDLTLHIYENKGALSSLIEYETDLFEAETIQRINAHFEELLKVVIKHPNIIISDIDIQTDAEKLFYKTVEKPPRVLNTPHKSIHNLITTTALKNPDATAVVYKNVSITYAVLNKSANTVAASLLKFGVKKNDIVGLCIERSVDMVIGLLGILKAGAAYLPLDPEYPTDRTLYILKDANVNVVVTQQKLSSKFSKLSNTILNIEAIQNQETLTKIDLPNVNSDDLAYVIYTSGSTGVPKGVPITHKNILNSTLARTEFYGYNPTSFLLMSSISFDSSKAGLFWSLCFGGTLVVSEKHLEQDIDALTSSIQQNNVTHTLMLPSLYSHIMTYGDKHKLQSLDTVIVAGEACSVQLAKRHFNNFSNIKLYNEYGPTESTVWCIAHQIKKEDCNKNSIPIGRPIQNIQVFILNNDFKKVPYGTVGELYIGGTGLTDRYLNDPQKTKNAFITFDVNDEFSTRLYKTGDLAKFTPDGSIEFLGRKDHQVKIRGYRIELDEIEQQIKLNNSVKKAVVKIENELSLIDWRNLNTANNSILVELLNKHFTTKEIDNLLTPIELLKEEALEILLQNID